MEVPTESFHRSSWDSRTCYPWRATNLTWGSQWLVRRARERYWIHHVGASKNETTGNRLLKNGFSCDICGPWLRDFYEWIKIYHFSAFTNRIEFPFHDLIFLLFFIVFLILEVISLACGNQSMFNPVRTQSLFPATTVTITLEQYGTGIMLLMGSWTIEL